MIKRDFQYITTYKAAFNVLSTPVLLVEGSQFFFLQLFQSNNETDKLEQIGTWIVFQPQIIHLIKVIVFISNLC